MSDKIPDDIMAAATAALNDMPVGLMNWNEARRATAHAILAERERCAGIAKTAWLVCPYGEIADAEVVEKLSDWTAAQIRRGA